MKIDEFSNTSDIDGILSSTEQVRFLLFGFDLPLITTGSCVSSLLFGSFRKQNAVYWADSGVTDGFGSPILQAPLEIDVRWELKNELYVDDKGNEKISNAIVYPNTELELSGYLYLGCLDSLSNEQKTDPTLIDNAFIISKIQKIFDINNIKFMFKVWL